MPRGVAGGRRLIRDLGPRSREKIGRAPSAALLLFAFCVGSGRALATQAPPCAKCVAWELSTAQARDVLASEIPLEGVPLLLRSPVPVIDGLEGLMERLRERGAQVTALLSAPGEGSCGEATDTQDFQLKAAATLLRATGDASEVGLDGSEGPADCLVGRGLEAYFDFFLAAGPSAVEPHFPGLPVRLRGDLGSTLGLASVLAASARADGHPVVLPWPEAQADWAFPARLARLSQALPEGLVALPEVQMRCDVPCRSEVYLHPGTLEAVAVLEAEQPVGTVEITPGATGVIVLSLDGDRPAPRAPAVVSPPGHAVLPAPARSLVLQVTGWSAQGSGRFAAETAVVAARTLSVEEVVARHQAAAARQRRGLPRLISSGSLDLAFEAPGLRAPLNLTAEIVLYQTVESRQIEERGLRLNGLELARGGQVPRLPLIEPERVAAPPLALVLGDAYRYRLLGRGAIAGRDCYLVGFAPEAPDGPSFHGKAWIAAVGFGLVRLEAAESGLRGAIVSSWQRDDFKAQTVPGGEVWLLERSEVHQIYEGPGHRTPVHRVLRVEHHVLNPPDFESRLEAAQASPSVMIEDTARGLRYLRRLPEQNRQGGARREPAASSARVWTAVGGVLSDPGIGDPLPFGGLGLTALDLFGKGIQANAFVAGAFGRLAVQAPSLAGSRWRLHGYAFGSLIAYNDRVFREGRERYEENLRQRPQRWSLGLSWPLASRSRLRLDYEASRTWLGASPSLAPGFVVPASPWVHGLRLSLEAEAGAWAGSASWSEAWRTSWRAWGLAERAEPTRPHFERFSLGVKRSLSLSPSWAGRIEITAQGGRHLDRFSRYGFDGFENSLAGYPAWSVRYDRGVVARGSLTWRSTRGLRVGLLGDLARVHDSGLGPGFATLPGLGLTVDVTLVGRLLLAGEWGYGFEGRDREGRRGTQVVKLTAYRVF